MALEASDEPWGEQLRRWREEAKHWTQEDLVEQVVTLAFQDKDEVRGTKLTIEVLGRWERGEVTRPQAVYRRLLGQLGAPLPTTKARSDTHTAPRLPAEQLSAAVVPDNGDEIEDSTHYPENVARSIEIFRTLADADLMDEPAVTALPWAQSATPGIVYNYLGSGPLADGLILPGYASSSVADRILSTVQSLLDLDFQYGGGHVRGMLLMYWKTKSYPRCSRATLNPSDEKSSVQPPKRPRYSPGAHTTQVGMA
jgi:transcriptional regulator with XRE-family HTH domain